MTREDWKNTRRDYERHIIVSWNSNGRFAWSEVERLSPIQISINKVTKEININITMFFKSGTMVEHKEDIKPRFKKVVKKSWFNKEREIEVPFTHQDYFNCDDEVVIKFTKNIEKWYKMFTAIVRNK